jgi:flagellar hook-associated protein 2
MAITAPTFDPKATATNLAQLYVQGRQDILNAQSSTATAVASALTKLSSAMSTFRSSLSSLSSQSSVLANQATFSTDVGSASASASATAGTYQFYVEQLATAGQVSYNTVSDTAAATAGDLIVTLADGSNFTVTLANADSNLDGNLTAKEIAAAINVEATNNSRVTASTLTVNGVSRLVLTSTQTGANNAVTGIDTSQITDPQLAAELDMGAQTVLKTAQDAIVWIGAQGGDPANQLTQASNTFSVVDGVSITFTKAQAVGADPVTLTVARDDSATAANVQKFVDSYNALLAIFKDLTAAGNPATGKAAGIYANDAGLASLKNSMRAILRTEIGGQSLATYGVTSKRDGTLALDSTRLNKMLATNPSGLDAVLGKASLASPSGVMGSLDTLLNSWTKTGTGQLDTREQSNTRLQAQLTSRMALLETQYDNAYKRYLAQFTQLQNLQSQMNGTTSMFDALFSKPES